MLTLPAGCRRTDTIAGLRRNASEIRTRCLREIKRMERIEMAIKQLQEQSK